MEKIYIAHSRDFDFKRELYDPIRKSNLNSRYDFILPHETDQFFHSKEVIKKSRLVVAEVSFPATGEGIELGWADSFNIPIVCFYKEGMRPSGSIKAVTNDVIPYTDSTDILKKLERFLSQSIS